MSPISVIIPAYNEAEAISNVIANVKKFMTGERIEHEIIVVDDCSIDGTAAEAKSQAVTVVSHPMNMGYGAALTTGLKKARYNDILIMDADESYPVDEVKKLLPHTDGFDMVVGARQGKYYHGSPLKRISRMIFSALLRYVTGEDVPDANSGLRFFKKDVVMRFEDDFCSGFSFTTTITIILLSNGCPVKFVPIEYAKRTGASKVRHIRDTARTVQILLHTIIYYNPVKAFLPFVMIMLAMSVIFKTFYIFGSHDPVYGLSAVVSFIASMVFMSFGMMTYAIVKSGRR